MWWSAEIPDSDPPCRYTTSRAGSAEDASTPESVKPCVRAAPETIASHSQMSGASSSPGW